MCICSDRRSSDSPDTAADRACRSAGSHRSNRQVIGAHEHSAVALLEFGEEFEFCHSPAPTYIKRYCSFGHNPLRLRARNLTYVSEGTRPGLSATPCRGATECHRLRHHFTHARRQLLRRAMIVRLVEVLPCWFTR